jgi:hypothetical protein
VVRKIALATGQTATLEGNPELCGIVDSGGAAPARLNRPTGLALDGAGNLYFTEVYDQLVRKIALASGRVSTIAGVNDTPGATDSTTGPAPPSARPPGSPTTAAPSTSPTRGTTPSARSCSRAATR